MFGSLWVEEGITDEPRTDRTKVIACDGDSQIGDYLKNHTCKLECGEVLGSFWVDESIADVLHSFVLHAIP